MSVQAGYKLFYWAVGSNIKKYRDIRNMSLQDLGEKVGVTKKTIQRYENGEIRVDMDRIETIAEALEVEVAYLLDGAQSFLGLDVTNIGTTLIPLVGRVCCGNGVLAFEDVEEYIPVAKDFIKNGEHIFLRAKGDSMIGSRIIDGDLILIRKQPTVEEGEIAAVLIGEEAVLKKVYKNGDQLVLQSSNPDYPPIFCSKDDNVTIIGKVKWNMIEY
ncbi:LexA family transcriptional repressor [Paenibacillus sp. FSL H7-0326]|uniref:LexA family protein n=1 Tax=Paenibacillus sp. FSL H7-0326 TaxID=1921144 RepID=UPI00096CF0D4|nr:LexA family transcriptional regulator [Paenibacillus sp. FSL H7-0326]OMC71511.1 LexA family transcriptional repressor [Paenibacillus sp. FSL H7-0326]